MWGVIKLMKLLVIGSPCTRCVDDRGLDVESVYPNHCDWFASSVCVSVGCKQQYGVPLKRSVVADGVGDGIAKIARRVLERYMYWQ